ncbi:MAG: CotH kinase family protein [Crocinitomicaceae bacterium]
MKKKIISLTLIIVISLLILVFAITRPPQFNLDKLHININTKEYQILEKLRENALSIGHLDRSPNDFVAASFKYNNVPFNGKIRLKGDLLDHLKEDKWSFRIKLNSPMKDGLQVFSIQNPESRGFLNSYVYHHLLKQEGILSNEFRFTEVFVNGNSWGIYCIEEHLSQRMITSQNKPNGLLLKFTDHSFFNADEGSNSNGLIKQAKIKLYPNIKKGDVYNHEARIAKEIMRNYQHRIDSSYVNFNATQTGLYYALCDLAAAYHAMGWINIRFYFNFETQKMEPVGYDAYPVLEWGKPYLGKHVYTTKLDSFETRMIVYSALKNESISAAYHNSLKRIIEPDFINNFMEKHHAQLVFLEQEIQKEYKYEYDYNFIKDNGKEIQTALKK